MRLEGEDKTGFVLGKVDFLSIIGVWMNDTVGSFVEREEYIFVTENSIHLKIMCVCVGGRGITGGGECIYRSTSNFVTKKETWL